MRRLETELNASQKFGQLHARMYGDWRDMHMKCTDR